MIVYNTQAKKGSYKIQFETDDWDCYKRVQNVIRDCVERNEGRKEEIITCFEDLVKPKKER